MLDLGSLRYNGEGLIPVIAQDATSGEVLMLGYGNSQTLAESLEIGKMVFFSRSRNQRWLKGETSGNFLELVSLQADCDSDAVLARVQPHGPTCHLGTRTCFGDHA
jgi:phosphoribosyl-ATP pyrophosphohydrolase/phosphoribosyl-AMP cyclohydrolase